MILAFAITLVALTGQTTELPLPNEEIFKITFSNGEIRYGAIRERGSQITMVFDEPWEPKAPRSFARTSSLDFEYESEIRVEREERLEREGREAGYIEYNAPDGKRWLPEKEVQYFKRAQTMARQAALPPPTPDTTAEAEAPPAPGIVTQFGPHAAILVVGLVLLGVILKTLILSE